MVLPVEERKEELCAGEHTTDNGEGIVAAESEGRRA